MLDVVYANGPCLVVAKPAGLLTQAPPGIDSLEVRIKDELGADYLGVVHRTSCECASAVPVIDGRISRQK